MTIPPALILLADLRPVYLWLDLDRARAQARAGWQDDKTPVAWMELR
jgi:hypothetical protein